jgi:hypothetical protein
VITRFVRLRETLVKTDESKKFFGDKKAYKTRDLTPLEMQKKPKIIFKYWHKNKAQKGVCALYREKNDY